ncbi:MAG: response regulator, partial [Desulfatibacillum sp.]|nr:response regulator [Desulfatibacillum sp.]
DANHQIIAVCVTFQDITEQKKAEKERAALKEQFHQAQKIESVGRLAGGVAHDFNNMLSVIIGHTEMALEQLDKAQPLFADLKEVHSAALRSADLTRQLLAFARKQAIAPKKLDLNEALSKMLKMLQRLMGEDIDLVWLPGACLGNIKMDPSQLDQILANLCVNARQAISGVGKVTIETKNMIFDEGYCADHPGFFPGEFVLLAVSDNGEGMNREILDHLFEPFFTTKEMGKGTGLGLATVYGIVKQNNGFINVYSEPGEGTTFKIYLPLHESPGGQVQEDELGEIEPGHGETILLVEDEAAIMKMGTMMLSRLGYTVLTANTPAEALEIAREHAGTIQLIFTDVIMPGMNGRDLAERVQALCPNLKVLYMSGYTANVIAHHGVLEDAVHFVQKPFSYRDLATGVHKALTA